VVIYHTHLPVSDLSKGGRSEWNQEIEYRTVTGIGELLIFSSLAGNQLDTAGLGTTYAAMRLSVDGES
jgi:hypothetical protein